jgi:hypothetical protein
MKKLVNEDEASEIIKLKPSTLRKRRCWGMPPAYLKIGSKIFYDVVELEKFLDSCICNPTSDTRVTK